MERIDLHVHSTCSPDAFDTMTDMAEAEWRTGVNVVCFTDHVDLSDYRTGDLDLNCFQWADMQAAHAQAKARWGDKIEILLGMELAGSNHYTEHASPIYETPGLDFIIGSIHNLYGTPDFYCLDFHDLAYCHKLIQQYLAECMDLAKLGYFDVMGHITYPLRYMRRGGLEIDFSDYYDELNQLFHLIIPQGKGIEINTSGLRSGMGETMPPLPILKLYREAGGEILTVGSDAHKVQDAGADIDAGYELARAAGFSYVTVFEARRPRFIHIY